MSTRGFSMSVGAGASGMAPPISDVDLYLDVTAGDDGNGGTSWADAYLTWNKANSEAERILSTHPTTSNITIYARNGTHGVVPIGSQCVSPHVSDRARVHVVQPVDQWEVVTGPGTVPIAGCNTEGGSQLAVVGVIGMVPLATDVGLSLRLRKIIGPLSEFIVPTILSVDVVNATYTVSMRNGDMPAWVDDDGATIVEVLRPYSICNGDFTFAPIAAQVAAGTPLPDGTSTPKNWLVGMRANIIIAGGEEVAMCGCASLTAAGVFGPMAFASGTGVTGRLVGATGATLEWGRANTWGLCGDTPVPLFCTGNSCSQIQIVSGSMNFWAGYCEGEFAANGSSVSDLTRCHAFNYLIEEGAHLEISYFRGSGDTNTPMLDVQGNGSFADVDWYYLVEYDKGQLCILRSMDRGHVVLENGLHCAKQTILPANYPIQGYVSDGGRFDILADGVPGDTLMTQQELVYGYDGAMFNIGGAISMVAERLGDGVADIRIVRCSRAVLRGDITKTVPNATACCCLDVDFGSEFVQESGDFVHGNAPADWTTSYGNLGLIHVADHSSATIGSLTDTAVGAGARIALQVRRYSSLWFGPNSVLTQAGNGLQVGTSNVPLNGATVQNDLPAAPAGTEELCVVGPTATP